MNRHLLGEKLLQRTSIIVLTLISMGVYWNTLSNDFVAGDRQFILRNPQLGNYRTALHSFTSDYWKNLGGESFIYYRPLTTISHVVDFQLYETHPAGHHFTNMVLHTIASLTVYQLLLYLLPSLPMICLVGASLFALHPIHTHSVAYIMGRTDILATIFYLWGLILLMGIPHHKKNYGKVLKLIVGACLCYFLSLLAKEIALTLPLVFLLSRFCWSSEQHPWKDSTFWVPLVALCATLSLYLVVRSLTVGLSVPGDVTAIKYSFWQRVVTVFITYGFYLVKLFYPLRLCYYSNIVVPELWRGVFNSPLFYTGVLLVVSFAIFIKWYPQLGFSLGWIVITLLPVLNLIPLTTLAKENFLYLPSAGFCLFLSMAIHNGWCERKHDQRRYQIFSTIIFIAIGILYVGATIRRNTDYRNPVIFLERTLHNMTPVLLSNTEDTRFFEGVKNFYTTYKNLGILYQERGAWAQSAEAFENALTFTPSYFSPEYAATVKVLLGTVYEKMGRLESALHILKEARSTTSKPSQVDNLLGIISFKVGQKEEAEFYFKRAIQKDDTYAPAHFNLGIVYMKNRLPHNGREELSKAIRLNPTHKNILARQGILSSFVDTPDESFFSQ